MSDYPQQLKGFEKRIEFTEWPEWKFGPFHRHLEVDYSGIGWAVELRSDGGIERKLPRSPHEAACLIRDWNWKKLAGHRIYPHRICGMLAMVRDIGGQIDEFLTKENAFKEIRDMAEIQIFENDDAAQAAALDVLMVEEKNNG